MTDSSNDQPGKPDITIQAPSDMPAEKQQAVQATAAWMTDDIARLVQQEPGGNMAKLIENSRGDQAELLRLVERNGQAFLDSLPRAVQDDIRAMQQQNMKNNNDDNDFRRRKKLEEEDLYGAAGIAGVRESNILEMGRGEGGNVSFSSDIDNMSSTERYHYFDKAEDLTLDQWRNLSDAERQKIIDNARKGGEELVAKAQGNLEKFNKEALNDPGLGATPAERKAALDRINNAADIDKGTDFEAAIANFSPEEKKRALELRIIKTDLHFGQNAIDSANRGDAALKRGDIDAAYPHAQSAAGDNRAAKDKEEKYTDKLNANAQQMSQAATPQAKAEIAKDSDSLLLDRNDAHTAQGVGNIRAADAGEQGVGAKADKLVVKQEFVQKAERGDDYGDDPAPIRIAAGDNRAATDKDNKYASKPNSTTQQTAEVAPAQVAAVGGRKSIDIPNGANGEPIVGPFSDMLAQLGATMETKKAEEPELKPENQQPKAPKTTLET